MFTYVALCVHICIHVYSHTHTHTHTATGLELRCDVFVDTIDHIEITTRTRELLLEEEPERFELQAFDDEGNMFSTVRGHTFAWTLLPDEEAVQQQPEPEDILNFIPFEESTYSTDPVIGRLESQVRVCVYVCMCDRSWYDVRGKSRNFVCCILLHRVSKGTQCWLLG